MLPIELVTQISAYMYNSKIKYLSKNIYDETLLEEKNKDWYDKYKNYFKKNNIFLPILEGNRNWKNEYCRINKYSDWKIFQNKNLVNNKKIILSNGRLVKLPKEFFNLTNTSKLILSHNNINKISEKILKFTELEELDLSFNIPIKISKNMIKLNKLKKIYVSLNAVNPIPNEIKNIVIYRYN